jgi:hypothetical protein
LVDDAQFGAVRFPIDRTPTVGGQERDDLAPERVADSADEDDSSRPTPPLSELTPFTASPDLS